MRILRTKQEQSNRSVASAVVSWSAEVVTMRTCWQLLVIHGVLRQWLAAQAGKSSDAMAEIKRKACLLLFRLQVIALNNLSFFLFTRHLPHRPGKRWNQVPIHSAF